MLARSTTKPGVLTLTYSKTDNSNIKVVSQSTQTLGQWSDIGNEGIQRRTVAIPGEGEIVIEEFSSLITGLGFFRVKIVVQDD